MPVATARNSECGAGAEWSEQARVCSSGRWRRSRSRLLSVPLPLWLSASAACNPTRARRTASLRGEGNKERHAAAAGCHTRPWMVVCIYLSIDSSRSGHSASRADSIARFVIVATDRADHATDVAGCLSLLNSFRSALPRAASTHRRPLACVCGGGASCAPVCRCLPPAPSTAFQRIPLPRHAACSTGRPCALAPDATAVLCRVWLYINRTLVLYPCIMESVSPGRSDLAMQRRAALRSVHTHAAYIHRPSIAHRPQDCPPTTHPPHPPRCSGLAAFRRCASTSSRDAGDAGTARSRSSALWVVLRRIPSFPPPPMPIYCHNQPPETNAAAASASI